MDIREGLLAANPSAMLGNNQLPTNKGCHATCLKGLVEVVLGVVLGDEGHAGKHLGRSGHDCR